MTNYWILVPQVDEKYCAVYDNPEFDDFGLPGVGKISTGSDNALVGRVGGQLAYVVPVSNTFLLQPFVGVSVWRNYENKTDLTFTQVSGQATVSTTSNPRDFTQFNVGIAFSESSANLVGYVQGTWREGSDISSAGVTAGGRINF